MKLRRGLHLPYYSVCTLSELFRHSVLVVDDEVLIEHFEDLAAAEVCHGCDPNIEDASRTGSAECQLYALIGRPEASLS